MEIDILQELNTSQTLSPDNCFKDQISVFYHKHPDKLGHPSLTHILATAPLFATHSREQVWGCTYLTLYCTVLHIQALYTPTFIDNP